MWSVLELLGVPTNTVAMVLAGEPPNVRNGGGFWFVSDTGNGGGAFMLGVPYTVTTAGNGGGGGIVSDNCFGSGAL